MIDEKFLVAAVKIRKTYLNLINNLDLYRSVAVSLNSKLESTMENLEVLESQYKDQQFDGKVAIDKVNKIINDVEREGKKLENLISPINHEIEKLVKEESELYNQIVQNHPSLTQEQIVNIVRDRLLQEGLE